MWHIFCMRLIYYSPNNFKILPDPYPYQLLNTSVRNCFGMIQSVSTSADVPSFQSVYLNSSQTKLAASNAGRHGKQSKRNCKTRNRRVSIPYIWGALSTLHWPSAKDKRWLRPNWRAPGYIDPYITVYCLSGVFMRCSIRCDPIFLSSTVDTTSSILHAFCSLSCPFAQNLFHMFDLMNFGIPALEGAEPQASWPSPQHSLTTTTEPRLFSAGTSWASWNDGIAMWMPGGKFDANNMQI